MMVAHRDISWDDKCPNFQGQETASHPNLSLCPDTDRYDTSAEGDDWKIGGVAK